MSCAIREDEHKSEFRGVLLLEKKKGLNSKGRSLKGKRSL